MQTIHRLAVRCVSIASLVVSLPASAYLQFTYTSKELPLTSYLIEEWPQDISEILIPPPILTLSFTASEPDLTQGASNSFTAENFNVSLSGPEAEYLDYPLLFDPSSYGHVTLDEDGNVADWDFMLQVTELVTPETNMLFHGMHDYDVKVISNSASGDQVINRFHPITWVHGNWMQLVQLEITFANVNDSGTWTVEEVTVPEPGLAGLLLSGTAMLLWSRRRSTRSVRNEKYV